MTEIKVFMISSPDVGIPDKGFGSTILSFRLPDKANPGRKKDGSIVACSRGAVLANRSRGTKGKAFLAFLRGSEVKAFD
jgi:hypothetical protein